MIGYEAAAEAASIARPKPRGREAVGLLASWFVVLTALVVCVGAQVLGLSPGASSAEAPDGVAAAAQDVVRTEDAGTTASRQPVTTGWHPGRAVAK